MQSGLPLELNDAILGPYQVEYRLEIALNPLLIEA